MKKLTRKELKNVMGGLQDPPPGCYCFTPDDTGGPGEPGGGIDPDCFLPSDSQLYCPLTQILVCC